VGLKNGGDEFEPWKSLEWTPFREKKKWPVTPVVAVVWVMKIQRAHSQIPHLSDAARALFPQDEERGHVSLSSNARMNRQKKQQTR
jgi:hypothetical protein